ncbi:uncharacterized protein LOC582423 [Strongylocentrotus purpuratus]|uniref:Uncharacterized protein n=1 Tax=Strongylocentrotus purpuratus TaxID=7668 RepID=A0A7M7THI8_STRPU|nr:uncharacterized protein LOC582423 [Strongylocentrotus purpuratus]|eukprot:XP_800179.1 PREDICTED: uncharacterized protein LOC582423 [Strongylocentrotus purpuratus]
MKQIITSLVSISAALLLFVLISEYTPRCNGQVHHRFSGWRPGGKKRSDAAEVNSNKITIERPQLPICQTTEERQLLEGDSDILGDLRRAANRMRLLQLFNLSKTRLNDLNDATSNEVDERPVYGDYLGTGL